MSDFYRRLGMRLRQARTDRRYTQKRVAAKVGLVRTSIANIERGDQRLYVHTLAALAEALGVSIAELIPPPLKAEREEERDRLEKEGLAPVLISSLMGTDDTKGGTDEANRS